MDKTYDPLDIEQRRYAAWEADGCFAPSGEGTPYCIMIPPPNVTGTLHMGHAFQDTIMDALIRYHRMRGFNTLWQTGMDHAGIATQMVVERQLNAEDKTRREIGRDAFLERVWAWKEHSGGAIANQFRRIGCSIDWSRERFTMDEGLSKAVLEVFVRLHEEGLIYRGKRLVNWDPVLHTALSDLEVISQEEEGHLWHFRYPRIDGKGEVIVATTRPETMLGDTAVAVHPEDDRYRDLVGREVELPLTGRHIPVIADEYVDPEFGTGCVKITPAHDFNDYEVGKRHGLALINVFHEDATLNENAPPAYRTLGRFEARRRIVQEMDSLGLLAKTADHRMMVPRGDRSGEVVEPFLTDQWYVRIAPLAEPAIAAVETGAIRFVPENWSKTYFEWMHNIEDWCISRQLWWGHRIPAWYDDAGNVYVGRTEQEAREKHALAAQVTLHQDEDVLDTWFSSALWPFSTLGWPDDTPELATFYPTNVLVTGFDIIFFWVARMIMMGLKFTGEVPFREIYIHGLVRDADGHKMSKSKGNVLDPLDLIQGVSREALITKRTGSLMQPQMKARIEAATVRQFPDGIQAYGTDALRFTFAALATTGRDISFDLGRVDGYRKFCNKLWNASRFVLMNTEGEDCGLSGGALEHSLPDRWVRSRLAGVTAQVHGAFASYRFDLAAQALYEFTWREFCDWYLELTKPVLQGAESDEALARGTRHTLVSTLESLLRLLHPIMPFITEEIWQRVAPLAGRRGATIMREPYPQEEELEADVAAEAEMQWIMDFVVGLRQIRGEMDVAPTRPVPVLLQGAGAADLANLTQHRHYLQRLAHIASIDVLDDGQPTPASATALLGEMKVLVPLAGLIDVSAELTRLGKRIAKERQELEKTEARLANSGFVSKAPAHVVKEKHDRVHELRASLTKLDAQRERLETVRDES